jgi:hypothetical protein
MLFPKWEARRATLEECDITQMKRISGGSQFVCNQCLYKVALSSFGPKDGNVRTQAATAVTQHAAATRLQSFGPWIHE